LEDEGTYVTSRTAYQQRESYWMGEKTAFREMSSGKNSSPF